MFIGEGVGAGKWPHEKRMENEYQGWTDAQLVNTCCEGLSSIPLTYVKVWVWWLLTVPTGEPMGFTG